MSGFVSTLREVLADPYANDGTGLWRLISPLRYRSDLMQQDFVIPSGFTHDHASVPRAALIYANFGNRYHRPAVVHDYLCRFKVLPRDMADTIFLEAMRSQNAEELKMMAGNGTGEDEMAERHAQIEGRAQLMYAAVAAYTKSGAWRLG